MKKLKPKQKTWLVSFHVFFAGTWIGAGICLLVLIFSNNASGGDMLHGFNLASKIVDDFVIIPAAIGSLLSGLFISLLTNWGFFRFKWVTIKWILTVGSILFGTFFLGPWLNGMEALSTTEGFQIAQSETYQHSLQMIKSFGNLQVASLIFMVFISVLKPWGKWKKQSQKFHAEAQ